MNILEIWENEMNKEQGQIVKALYNACIDLPSDQQLKFIQNSGADEVVKAKVLQLLNYSGDIDQMLSKSVLETAKASMQVDDLQAGQVIEHYELQRKIGEGGQGEVWLAARNDGEFDHQVAIKFLKVTANEMELQRFQTERELLAGLKHPNIASLLGGGQNRDRGYMIMEWIDGVPLLEYIRGKQLGLRQTLGFFTQICEAVSHAHSQGVIHRDIKPSNILVTAQGLVKLLDFGIAKVIDTDNTETQADVMLTFAYTTPEQIAGGQITTATDVYALGLLLYEMLTGQRAQSHADTPAALIHDVTENMPPKPSKIALQDQTTPFKANLLSGDLDNLVLQALRKEPERRYKNADALLADVDNYLAGKPLKASGDGWLYRGSKAIKRNPLTSTLAAAVLIFLITLPILLFQNSERLRAERDKANEQALIANKTTEFLTTLFEAVSPLGSGGKEISLDAVLAQGERQLAAGMVAQPDIEAALSMILAAINHHLENTPKAIDYYQLAIDHFKEAGDVKGQLSAEGQLALMYFRNDQVPASEAYFTQADQTAESLLGQNEWVIHMTRKATVATERGQRQEAAQMLSAVYDQLNDEQRQDIELMSRLYHVWGEAIKYSDKELALEMAEKSTDLTRQQVGSVHPFYLKRINSQAVRLMRLNRHGEAKKILDEVMQLSETLYSDDHPQYASFVSAKGTFLHDRGLFGEAAQVYEQSLSIYRKHYGEADFETARMINNLAYLYEDMGRFEAALPLYQQSIEIRRQLDPENTIRIATAQANLARLLAKLNRHEESAALLMTVMPEFSAHQRNNLYNDITALANTMGDGSDSLGCEQGKSELSAIENALQKEPASSWRRLGAEVWLSQMLKTCGFDTLANQWLLAAVEKSKSIYLPGSEGQKIIQDLRNQWMLEKNS
jgi:serine/threonine protein kinase